MDKLIRQLDNAFSTDEVNIDDVKDIMRSYPGNKVDWNQFAYHDKTRYTRNLISKGNDHYNLILLCWGEGQGSSIHDHSNAHCVMKILQGQVKESRFDWPDTEAALMITKDVTIHKTGEVAYINDSYGLHRVENPSHTEPAVTLHLYSPPFNSCATFDQKSGKKSTCPVTFWSRYGNLDTSLTTPPSIVMAEDN